MSKNFCSSSSVLQCLINIMVAKYVECIELILQWLTVQISPLLCFHIYERYLLCLPKDVLVACCSSIYQEIIYKKTLSKNFCSSSSVLQCLINIMVAKYVECIELILQLLTVQISPLLCFHIYERYLLCLPKDVLVACCSSIYHELNVSPTISVFHEIWNWNI